jgi:peptide/nickel transport system substrate-binding protein
MPGEIGHNPDLKPYAHDPAKARRLLAEAGYPSGLRLSVVVKAQGERTMRILSAQLRKVGIELEQHLTTDAAVIRDIQSRPWDFTFGGCPDPIAHSFFIQSIFLSSVSPYSITRDREYDRRLELMVTSLDPAEQDRAGRELDRHVYEEALSLFTYQRVKTYGVSKGIIFVPSVTGMPYFNLSHPHEESSKKRAVR